MVGCKPSSLSNAEAAALRLTAITAWEILFDHLGIVQQPVGKAKPSSDIILVVGAAGGVGSMLIQITKAITGATIIATASRASSSTWVKQLGADYVVDHSKPLAAQIEALNIGRISHVASLNSTDSYFDSYIEILAPFGKIAVTDDPTTIDIAKMKLKSLSLHIECMSARAMFNAEDMIEQIRLLNRVAKLVASAHIKTTVGKKLGTINAANLRLAHQALEQGGTIGKIVLEGF